MKKIIFLLLLLPFGAYADELVDMGRFNTFTKNIGTVSASFEQMKILPETTKQFVSTGRVKFQKDVGFIWIQDTPTKQKFVSTKQQYCVDGVAQDLKNLPYFYYVREIIDSALNGDISGLQMVFNVDYSEYGKKLWQMTVRPRFTAVADILQDVVMYGSTTELTKAIITYNDGTIVIIQFKPQKVEIQDEIAC
ncbi:MAG: outer membrane lipoprotein carrier protein LolA [Alphaproteobacteria bacterium]|nr:outer membrane lipoprotein carrier protein LolA [Alphaproteobacteria bacterium]